MQITPNRVAAIVASIASLLAALAPAIANLDLSSTIGIVGGIGAVTLIVRRWLEGWQLHESRAFHEAAAAEQADEAVSYQGF